MIRAILACLAIVNLAAGAARAADPAPPSSLSEVCRFVGEIRICARSPDPWARRATPAEMARVYPAEALGAGIGGKATLECKVGGSGGLEECIAVRAPGALPRYDFERAALKLAPLYEVRKPLPASTVRFTVAFDPAVLQPPPAHGRPAPDGPASGGSEAPRLAEPVQQP